MQTKPNPISATVRADRLLWRFSGKPSLQRVFTSIFPALSPEGLLGLGVVDLVMFSVDFPTVGVVRITRGVLGPCDSGVGGCCFTASPHAAFPAGAALLGPVCCFPRPAVWHRTIRRACNDFRTESLFNSANLSSPCLGTKSGGLLNMISYGVKLCT